MTDLMFHGVLGMPLPDDPAEMDVVTWVQFRDRAREASTIITALNGRIRELETALYQADEGCNFRHLYDERIQEEMDRIRQFEGKFSD